jgi:hypothetical protein
MMEEIKDLISDSFYTQPLMIICALIAFCISILNRNKFSELQLIFFYPIASVIQILLYYYSSITLSDSRLDNISSSLFIVLEFLIFYYFFNKIIILKKLKAFIRAIFLVFTGTAISIWCLTNSFYENSSKVFLIQSICVLCFCFSYFFQLFQLPPKVDLLNHPAFWVSTGCLFYFSSTIPLFCAESLLKTFPQYMSLYSINYLSYSILFLFITKAFLCSPRLTK